MKTAFLRTTVCLSTLFLFFHSYSQNVTIDYGVWNPSNPACDIFNTATSVTATINGGVSTITHVTMIGDTKFNTSFKAVQLDNNYLSAGSNKGTKYRLAYNFKQGYRYIITVNSSELNSTAGTTDGPYLRLDMSNSTITGGSACIGVDNVTPDLNTPPVPVQYSSASFQDQQFAYATPLSSSYSMLEVTSFAGQNVGDANSVLIKKITIAETPPPFTVSLTPPYTSCGSSNPITFTINNVNGATGITAYNWNLGSASNNWLYMGNPALQYISTGTTNTLSLTPVCGSVPSSVSGSVTLNGLTVNTANSASLSYNPFNSSINGTPNLCSGSAIYSVNNLPCGASVAWSLSPSSGVVIPSCLSCVQTTLTKQSVGTVTLTANVTNACGITVAPISKTISTDPNTTITGNYLFASYGLTLDQGPLYNNGQPKMIYINNTNTVQCGFTITNTGLTGVSWTVSGACSNVSTTSTSFYCVIPAPGNGASGITATLHATGPCGTAISQPYSVSVMGTNHFVKVSPNPATNSLKVIISDIPEQNVTSDNSKAPARSITEIKIFDNVGNLKKVQKESKTKQASVNVRNLKSGIYVIEVFDGNSIDRQQIIIQK